MVRLLDLARRLQKTNSILLLPRIFTSRVLPPASPTLAQHNLRRHFSGVFRRTPFDRVRQSRNFSSFQSAQTYEIIDFEEYVERLGENPRVGVREFIGLLEKAKDFASGDEAIAFLDQCSVKPSKDFVFLVIWGVRDQWQLAYLAFKWGEKWECIVEKTWCLVIWVLGNHKKFSIAWALISDLVRNSVDVQEAVLIMIDRYAAANYPDKAMRAFQIMENFSLSPDQKAFLSFLDILCKHGFIEEAEEFMLVNKKLFPLGIDGFNVILNGWCNIAVDISEAKRVWRELSKCCIVPNGTSYMHMISCFSKVGNLFDSLRLYDEMKKRGWVPGASVYNSLVYILTCENCLKEALKIVDKMKKEGVQPDSTTYNSIIFPLCEASKLEEARAVLAMMIGDNVSPTRVTYHALLAAASLEGTTELLNNMRKAGLGPSRDTFLLALDRFFKLKDPESSMKLWVEMRSYEVMPDSAHYTVMVEGLLKCGMLVRAKELYAEMKRNGIVDDPKLQKLMKLKESNRNGGNQSEREDSTVKRGKRTQWRHHREGNVVRSQKHDNPTQKKR
nr:pentatricopeptide repeat-containing protein At1g80880, mitochondrial [Ipomoea batatas]